MEQRTKKEKKEMTTLAEKQTLKDRRTELFYQASIKEWSLQKVFEILYKQDEQFLQDLKETIEKGVVRCKVLPLDWCFDRIDELSGFTEEKGAKQE